MFDDILSKIKRQVLEPKIFTLLVSSAHGQVLHLGVHFSLEEAYAAARKRMELLSPHTQEEAIEMQLWNSMPARQAIAHIIDPSKAEALFNPEHTQTITPFASGVFVGNGKLPPLLEDLMKAAKPLIKNSLNDQPTTVIDHIQELKNSKNNLMKKLIEDGDENQVERAKWLLGAYSKRYVLKAIGKKLPKTPPVSTRIDPNIKN